MRRRVAEAINHCSIRAIDDTGASWVFYSWYGLFVLGVGQKPKLISGKKSPLGSQAEEDLWAGDQVLGGKSGAQDKDEYRRRINERT